MPNLLHQRAHTLFRVILAATIAGSLLGITFTRFTPYRRIVHPVTVTTHLPTRFRSATGVQYAGTVATLPATLQNPFGLAYDTDDGRLYVLSEDPNSGQYSILRVDLSTAASTSFAKLPGPAVQLAYDHANRTFYAVTSYNALAGKAGPGIYSINSSGAAQIFAGGSAQSFQDGPLGTATFFRPTGITVDTAHNVLYVIDSAHVRQVSTTGNVHTINSSVGGPNDAAIAYNPVTGYLYVADTQTNEIFRVSPAGAATLYAGRCLGTFPYNCDALQRDGHSTSALFAQPRGIRADPTNGTLYVADTGNNSVRKIDTLGNVTTLAGNGMPLEVDGVTSGASINNPIAIEYGSATGVMYIVDFWQYPAYGTALRRLTIHGPTAPVTPQKFALFDTTTLDAHPYDIAACATCSAYLWFTEQQPAAIVRMSPSGAMTEFHLPSGSAPQDITLATNGTPWFTDGSRIGYLAPSTGAAHEFAVSGASSLWRQRAIAWGPDGKLWFTWIDGSGTMLGNVTTAGVVTQYRPAVSLNGAPTLTFAADGNVWIADWYKAARISRTGVVLAVYAYPANGIVRGPDGNPWFTQASQFDAIGTINPTTGVVEAYPIMAPYPNCTGSFPCRALNAIVSGPDAALWAAEPSGTNIAGIGRMTTGGSFAEWFVPAARSKPADITVGPDGNIWFLDAGAQKIGRVNIR